MRKVLFALGLLFALPLMAVEAEHPWIAEAPPNAQVLAGYMTLKNPDAAPAVLVGVESPLFQRVEMHRMVMDQGMARMEPLERITIPPRGKVELAPGGYHLMLMRPKRPLKAGDEVPLKLHFEDGRVIEVEAVVKKRGGHYHHHH